jgi:transposase-like protein
MSRHYTDEEKRLILDRLIANHGDVARTADEFHVTTTTIYRWMKAANVEENRQLQLQQLQQMQHFQLSNSPSLYTERGQGGEVPLPEETTAAFQTLHDKLLAIADTLSNRIIEAIDDAPLNQRMTALSQLIDRIAKLAALLPVEEEEIEYVHEYEYEVEHHVEKRKEADEEAKNHDSSHQNQTED